MFNYLRQVFDYEFRLHPYPHWVTTALVEAGELALGMRDLAWKGSAYWHEKFTVAEAKADKLKPEAELDASKAESARVSSQTRGRKNGTVHGTRLVSLTLEPTSWKPI